MAKGAWMMNESDESGVECRRWGSALITRVQLDPITVSEIPGIRSSDIITVLDIPGYPGTAMFFLASKVTVARLGGFTCLQILA
eukprot:3185402-Rhodomonas_salina.1